MSRRVNIPYIVAGLTGILSGYYIFRPPLEQAAVSTTDTREQNLTQYHHAPVKSTDTADVDSDARTGDAQKSGSSGNTSAQA